METDLFVEIVALSQIMSLEVFELMRHIMWYYFTLFKKELQSWKKVHNFYISYSARHSLKITPSHL